MCAISRWGCDALLVTYDFCIQWQMYDEYSYGVIYRVKKGGSNLLLSYAKFRQQEILQGPQFLSFLEALPVQSAALDMSVKRRNNAALKIQLLYNLSCLSNSPPRVQKGQLGSVLHLPFFSSHYMNAYNPSTSREVIYLLASAQRVNTFLR